MGELARSALGFTLALPLFGLQQGARLLDPAGGGWRRAASGFDGVSRAAERELGGTLAELAQLGDCLPSSLAALGSSLAHRDNLRPAAWTEAFVDLARRSAEGLRQVAEGNALVALDEVRAKAEVFCLVLDVGRTLGVPAAPPVPLLELVGRAYSLDPFFALWAVEGLGHDFTALSWLPGTSPLGLLAEAALPGLPRASLLMLHAGMGLAFAQRLLDGAEGRSAPELRQAVLESVQLCRSNSREGYAGPALESLGLVTRTFHPGLVPAVDGVLRGGEPDARGYFWHGVGRALFFLPFNFLPGSDAEAFGAARREAPDEEARRNAVAGVAWASALVGQRNPRILAELVLRPLGEELVQDPAFANGVASSAIMRQDTTPDTGFLTRFVAYQPADPGLLRLWDALVRIPCEEALGHWYPVLSSQGRLGEIFRHQDLSGLAARLEGAAP